LCQKRGERKEEREKRCKTKEKVFPERATFNSFMEVYVGCGYYSNINRDFCGKANRSYVFFCQDT